MGQIPDSQSGPSAAEIHGVLTDLRNSSIHKREMAAQENMFLTGRSFTVKTFNNDSVNGDDRGENGNYSDGESLHQGTSIGGQSPRDNSPSRQRFPSTGGSMLSNIAESDRNNTFGERISPRDGAPIRNGSFGVVPTHGGTSSRNRIRSRSNDSAGERSSPRGGGGVGGAEGRASPRTSPRSSHRESNNSSPRNSHRRTSGGAGAGDSSRQRNTFVEIDVDEDEYQLQLAVAASLLAHDTAQRLNEASPHTPAVPVPSSSSVAANLSSRFNNAAAGEQQQEEEGYYILDDPAAGRGGGSPSMTVAVSNSGKSPVNTNSAGRRNYTSTFDEAEEEGREDSGAVSTFELYSSKIIVF